MTGARANGRDGVHYGISCLSYFRLKSDANSMIVWIRDDILGVDLRPHRL